MDPFSTPRPRGWPLYPDIRVFSKDEVINFIKSTDFTSIRVPIEDTIALASSTSNPSQMSRETVDESLLIPAAESSNITQQAPALRVENLNVDVTETMLRKVFGRVGGVTSVSISRDPVTRKSNGIGHVKFINVDYGMHSFSKPC